METLIIKEYEKYEEIGMSELLFLRFTAQCLVRGIRGTQDERVTFFALHRSMPGSEKVSV
jgi:hypothetical protein